MKALLLIHGFISEMNDFDSIMDEVEKRYDFVYRPILPGHGDKGIYDYNNFNSKDTFKCVLDAFDYLKKNYKEIDVLGYSMGGALATFLSSVRKFNKLILVAPANRYFNPIAFVNGGTYAMSKFRALEKSIVKKDEAEQEAYKEVLKNFKVDQIKCASYTFRKYLKTYIWHAYKEFKDIVLNCNKDLKEIKNPTLILWSKLDQLVPYKAVSELYSMCTNPMSELKVFDDFTHLMLISDNPKPLIDAILEFMDKKVE